MEREEGSTKRRHKLLLYDRLSTQVVRVRFARRREADEATRGVHTRTGVGANFMSAALMVDMVCD